MEGDNKSQKGTEISQVTQLGDDNEALKYSGLDDRDGSDSYLWISLSLLTNKLPPPSGLKF